VRWHISVGVERREVGNREKPESGGESTHVHTYIHMYEDAYVSMGEVRNRE
jgi:hypothetical protein